MLIPHQDSPFKNYRLKDGIQGYQFMPNAVCKASNGYILFGGINGITSFKPESFTDNPFAPPVLITELKLFDKIVKPGDETGLLTSQISQTQRIVLRHDQSMISLKLAVANFVSGSHNTFAYKLEGYDNKWHHLTDDQNVIYSYLPPGTYRFLVKAANNDDKWNEILPCWKSRFCHLGMLHGLPNLSISWLLRVYFTPYSAFSRIVKEKSRSEYRSIMSRYASRRCMRCASASS